MNKTDISVILEKWAFGVFPVAGSLIAEIIGDTIPNQRIDRISALLKSLEEKIIQEEQKIILIFSLSQIRQNNLNIW